jgi:hypothetical protein
MLMQKGRRKSAIIEEAPDLKLEVNQSQPDISLTRPNINHIIENRKLASKIQNISMIKTVYRNIVTDQNKPYKLSFVKEQERLKQNTS